MDSSSSFSNDVLVSFITKDKKYSIPSIPISIKSKSTCEEFDKIIKTLIQENQDDDNHDLELIEFDFLINNKLLRTNIQEFLQKENLNQESQIEIEYFVKSQPPKPHKSFIHDDWVSSVHTIQQWIVSGCYDGTAHIWNVENGKHLLTIPAHTSSIKAVKWLNNNNNVEPEKFNFVTCSYDETAMLWNWNSKLNQIDHIYTFIGHCRSVDCCDSFKDMIATGSYDQLLKIWSIVDDNENDTADSGGESSKSKKPKENNKATNKLRSPIITLEGHKEAITGCTWMQDYEVPTVATCSLDNMLKIWDLEVGEQKQTINSSKAFMDISYCPRSSLFVTASCDRHVRVWDPRQQETGGNGSLMKQAYSSHEAWVTSVDWCKENENLFVSGSHDKTVKQWDIRSPSAPLYDMLGHQDNIMTVNWSNHKYIVSGGSDCQIKIFQT